MPASQAASQQPGRRITLEGIVLSSRSGHDRIVISVGDTDDVPVQTLLLEYAGPQRVHFEPGVIVIAHGALRTNGAFEVDEFVLKSPTGWAG